MNPRAQAAKILAKLLDHGKTIDVLLGNDQEPVVKAYVYQTCRWFLQVEAIADKLISKPLKEKDNDVFCLLLVGLGDLLHSNNKAHAIVNETVNATRNLKKPWAKGLINACLRSFQREQETLLANINKNDEAKHAHPQWFIDKIKSAWPNDWTPILNAGNHQAPMFLRVNKLKGKASDYEDHAEKIIGNNCIQLKAPISVEQLTGFREGHVSVQDHASQCVAPLLELQSKQTVLDACAAPGGKTGHLLETQPDILLTALDISEKRLQKVEENLTRLDFSANLKACDANASDAWWDGELFNRILIDAPCSGTGVIRRHPDIKLLRRESDIDSFSEQQWQLLSALWPLLKPQGILLYTTCSVLPDENEKLMQKFVDQTPDASALPITLPIGQACDLGWQCFPKINGHDGFYYCRLIKS
jgi:16S rRNA (cytosine967-C5)-methyltransferase